MQILKKKKRKKRKKYMKYIYTHVYDRDNFFRSHLYIVNKFIL